MGTFKGFLKYLLDETGNDSALYSEELAVILFDSVFFRRLCETANFVVRLRVGMYTIDAEFQFLLDMLGLEAYPFIV